MPLWKRSATTQQKPEKSASVRNLLMRLLIGGTTLVVTASAYYSYQLVRNLMLESLKQNAFLATQESGKEIDRWLNRLKAQIETLADTPMVRSLDGAKAAPYLRSQVVRIDDLAALAIAKPDGTLTRIDGISANIQNQAYFQKAIAGQTTVSDPLKDRTTQASAIVIATPIRQSFDVNSTPIGVMQSQVNLDRVNLVVESLHFGENSYAFALNSQGHVIVQPASSPTSTATHSTASPVSTAESTLSALIQQRVDKQQGIELKQIDGTWQYHHSTLLA